MQHRLLPGLDLLSPTAPVTQRFSGNGNRLVGIRSEEIGVAAQRLAAGGKSRHRQIPADHQRNLNALPGGQLTLHRQRSTEGIVGSTASIVVAFRDGAISTEAVPQLTPITAGIPTTAALDRHPGLLGCGNAPLALTFGNGVGDVALQHHSLEGAIVNATVALAGGAADGRGVVVLGAAVIAEVNLRRGIGVGEPAGGVAPTQQQRQIKRLIRGIAQRPDEHRHRVAGALVITRQDRAEGLTTHLGVIHALIAGPAEGITGGIGAGAAIRRAGRVPLPGL